MVIRKATIEDIEQIAKVHVQAWQETYTGLMPQSYLDRHTLERQLSLYQKNPAFIDHTYVLEINQEIVGFIEVQKCRDEDLSKEYGEVVAIYLLKKYHGQDLGGMLLDYGTGVLEQLRFRFISLWVLATNTHAIGFYEHEGYCQDGTSKTLVLDNQELTEIRMTRKINHYILDEEYN